MKQTVRGWWLSGLMLACSGTRPGLVSTTANAAPASRSDASTELPDAGGVAPTTTAPTTAAPATAAPTTTEPPTDVTSVVVGEQGDGNEVACALQLGSNGVTATCPSGAMRCATLLRGDVTPDPGEEVISRCEYNGARAFVVVSTASAVRWAAPLDTDDESLTCGTAPRLEAETIRVLDEGPRALLVRARDCGEPGMRLDWDTLWQWRDAGMQAVARAAFRCDYRGATAGPRASAPGVYACEGGYLTADGAGRVEALTVVGCASCTQRRLGTSRLLSGRGAVTQTLRRDPATGRFSAP